MLLTEKLMAAAADKEVMAEFIAKLKGETAMLDSKLDGLKDVVKAEAKDVKKTMLEVDNTTSNGTSIRLDGSKEIEDLKKKMKKKDDEIKRLRREKAMLESELCGCHQEIETLERNYDDLEKDFHDLNEASMSFRRNH